MRRRSSHRPSRAWHLAVLGVLAIGVAVLAVTQIGPPTSSARTAREVVTAADGVVQSTVTGSGNVEAGSDVDVNFQTSGTLAEVYVSADQHVTKGQLLAELDPTSAQLAVSQAESSLTAAEDQLTNAENGTSTSTGGGSSSGGTSSTSTSLSPTPATEFVSYTPGSQQPTGSKKKKHKRKHKQPASRPTTSTTPSSSASAAPARTSGTAAPTSTTATTTSSTPSPAAIASAQASVYSAQAAVQSAENTLAKTKLYAPISGTIVSLANLTTGDSISAASTGSAASSSSSSSSAGSTGSGASAAAGSLGSSSSSSSSSAGNGSSSSPFAEIVDASSMTMTVAFSESDISQIKVGQAATVTMDAISGLELAAHISSIATVGTSSSGVVSYDATLTLDQTDSRIKPGMSASASVIVAQAQGVTVPNQALTGTGTLGTVDVVKDGKTVPQQVIVGLRGDTRTQIVHGLNTGQQVVITIALPSLSSGSTSSGLGGAAGSGRFGGLGARLGGGGGFGGGGGGFFLNGGGVGGGGLGAGGG